MNEQRPVPKPMGEALAPQCPHLPLLGTRLLLRLSGAHLTPKGIPTAGVAGSV